MCLTDVLLLDEARKIFSKVWSCRSLSNILMVNVVIISRANLCSKNDDDVFQRCLIPCPLVPLEGKIRTMRGTERQYNLFEEGRVRSSHCEARHMLYTDAKVLSIMTP